MRSKKVLALILTVAMVFGTFSVAFAETEPVSTTAAGGATFTDVAGHWGAEAITKWSGYGIINGYEGMFRPDDSITRGEMAVILDNMMDYQAAATNTFVDLQAGQFYTEAILKANAAGIIKGDGTTVRPLDKITREESAVMMSRAFAVAGASATKNFNDASDVSVWAKSAVFGMEVAGYVNGYNGNFDPKSNITRAAAVTMINNIVKAYYTEAGTYTEDVNGTAVIKVAGVVLKGVDVSGNLIIAEGVAKGDATLDSVTVKGETVVRGGGENSIHIIGTSDITSIRIEKVGDKVRIVIANGLTVDTVEVAVGEEIIITGTVGTVEISATDATVYATGAKITTATVTGSDSTIIVDAKTTIGTVNIASTAENTSIQTQTGAIINEVNASAEINVSGTGSVNTVELNAGADGSSITTPNTTTNVESGVTGTTGTGGTAIPAGSTGTNGTSPTAPATVEETTPSGGGSIGGGGTPPVTPPTTPVTVGTLTFDKTTLKINNVSVPEVGGKYQIDKDWTSQSALTVTANGSGFVDSETYPMFVKVYVNGNHKVTFEQEVVGTDLNGPRYITSGSEVENNVDKDSLNDELALVFNLWLSAGKTAGDTVKVEIGTTVNTTSQVLTPLEMVVVE